MIISTSFNRVLSVLCFFCLLINDGVFVPKTFSQTVKQENKKSEIEQFANMAWVKGGNFLRGSTFKENQAALKLCRKYDRACKLWWFSDEMPLKLVSLKSFWIDIYETTNAQYLEFVKATGHRPALDDTCTTDSCWEGNLWKGQSFSPLIRNQPVTQVDWYDAVAYCEWKEKRFILSSSIILSKIQIQSIKRY